MNYRLLMVCCVWLPLMLPAQTPPLTLSQVLEMGLVHSKQLQATRARAEMAEARTTQMHNALLPTVSVAGGYTRLSNNITPFSVPLGPNGEMRPLNPQILNQYTLRASVQYSVFNGFRALYALRSAELLEQAAGLDVEKDQVEISHALTNACYNYYKLLESRKVLEASATLAAERVSQATNLSKQGMLLENDVLKAVINEEGLKQSLVEMDNAIATASYNLCLMLGLPPGATLQLDHASLFGVREVLTAVACEEIALSTRNDLRAADVRLLAAGQSALIAKGGYYPTVSVGANAYDNRPNQRVFPQEDAFKSTWDAGLSINYNLTGVYNTRAQREEAEANLRQSSSQRSLLEEAVRMEVHAAFYAWESARKKVTYCENTVNQAIENQRVTQNRFNLNTALLTDLLEADLLVSQSRLNLIQAKADAETAWHTLRKATGR